MIHIFLSLQKATLFAGFGQGVGGEGRGSS
jgi:hypothetical protein